jgi:NAD(P)-dependent dehydrogenase (short-subunit alcohol dehydrogenase family)
MDSLSILILIFLVFITISTLLIVGFFKLSKLPFKFPHVTETLPPGVGRENPEFNEKLMNRLPNKRWADPEELAGTAIFLASPASNLINGVTIPVDGGYTAS